MLAPAVVKVGASTMPLPTMSATLMSACIPRTVFISVVGRHVLPDECFCLSQASFGLNNFLGKSVGQRHFFRFPPGA